MKSSKRRRRPTAEGDRERRRREIARPAGALALLRKWGLLHLQSAPFPSLVSLLIGNISGSWWSHPQNSLIFHTSGAISDHPDVLTTKLLDRKITFVHRKWWPQLGAVGSAGDAWQTNGLSADARSLLRRARRDGELLAQGPAVRELEMRLLVAAAEIHTESGMHAIQVSSWEHFTERSGVAQLPPAASARVELEAAVARMNSEFGAVSTLPWK